MSSNSFKNKDTHKLFTMLFMNKQDLAIIKRQEVDVPLN